MQKEYKIVQIGVEYDYTILSCDSMRQVNDDFFYCVSLNRSLKGFLKLLYKLHTSDKLNRIVKMPFKGFWARRVVDKKISLKKDDNVCFLYQGGGRYFDIRAFEYLKKRYPHSVFVYIFGDLVDLNERNYPGFFDKCKKTFDLILTYNPIDADKYNLVLKKSMVPFFQNKGNNDDEKSDLLFVGREKGRFEILIDIFEKCIDNGLKCEFYILDVPKEKQIYKDLIHYDEFVPYRDVINKIKSTKCILDVSQEHSSGITLRVFESVGMGKLLMTNKKDIVDTPFFDPNKIIFIDSGIPFDRIKTYKEGPWTIRDDCSPSAFLKWFHNLLVQHSLLSKFE